eukprot:GHVU01126423.1.p6 GENE.GHVU01126423.1~~GHVU01126423.1.p6  ORF type:complete len:136 (+),score=22.47 GHVU01126423.1:1925-2332(+)
METCCRRWSGKLPMGTDGCESDRTAPSSIGEPVWTELCNNDDDDDDDTATGPRGQNLAKPGLRSGPTPMGADWAAEGSGAPRGGGTGASNTPSRTSGGDWRSRLSRAWYSSGRRGPRRGRGTGEEGSGMEEPNND